MEDNLFKPASEKQIAYLKKLGYEGDTEGMTSDECSARIQELTAKQNSKNEVAATTTNQVATKKSFSNFMQSVGSKLVANTITDESRKVQFISNIVSAVSTNPMLQECDQVSVISAGLQAESLHFPVNSQLGYCYLVPFNDKKAGMKKAQFMIGFKGYIQLAIRTGKYKNINVIEVKEGELNEFDPLKGMTFNWVRDYEKRKSLKTIGYVGEFELVNGFTKNLYISYEEMLDHADTYSQAFSKDATTKKMGNKTYKTVSYEDYKNGKYDKNDEWLYSSFWYKNFDEMAKKTVIRQLLSRWGLMSVEMEKAYDNDMAAFDIKGNREYVDSKEYQNDSIEEVFTEQQEAGTKSIYEDVVEDVNI